MNSNEGHRPAQEMQIDGVIRYAWGGVRAYRIPVESFPGHVTNVYLVIDSEATLIDVGFNSDTGRSDLEKGFATIAGEFGEPVSMADVASIIVTHGHGDHFGMLEHPGLKGKRLYMGPPDTSIIRDYHGEYLAWKRHIRSLSEEAGCDLDFSDMYDYDHLRFCQEDYQLTEVHDLDRIISGYTVHHTPGHTPGHICIGCGPFLFLGDHLLSITTPHQVPKSGWSGVGLEVYLQSLTKVAGLGFELGLPAHEETIRSIKDRSEEIRVFHQRRLDELCQVCGQGKNLYELTRDYYLQHPELIQAPSIDHLGTEDFILALEEIKAHVEHLVESGRMAVSAAAGGVPRYATA
ncbi:MAG: MBL fold metallo-hydrolase [Chloroflexi bacterium]|nr:MBL fold metallo-hydrolase [Chloroflexota bacterium]